MSSRVLGLYAAHENRALLAATETYAHGLTSAGFQPETLNLLVEDDFKRLLTLLENKEVAFAYGLQGIGSTLTLNDKTPLWSAAQTPFIGLHFDHPCHNPFNHINASPYVGNMYFFESFKDAKERYLPSRQLTTVVHTGFVASPKAISLSFRERPIRLLFVKGGVSLEETDRDLSGFDPPIQLSIQTVVAEAEKNPNHQICDLIAACFKALEADPGKHPILFWDMARTADRIIRRKRAIDFVNWLKMQEGAVIIGDGWDFIDKTGAKAEFRPAAPMDDVLHMYEHAQFVCNTNPYGPDIIHERITLGLAAGSCVITDSNAWWDHHFADVPALIRFNWREPLETQLAPVLAAPSLAAEAAQSARPAVMARFHASPVPSIARFAQEIATFAQRLA